MAAAPSTGGSTTGSQPKPAASPMGGQFFSEQNLASSLGRLTGLNPGSFGGARGAAQVGGFGGPGGAAPAAGGRPQPVPPAARPQGPNALTTDVDPSQLVRHVGSMFDIHMLRRMPGASFGDLRTPLKTPGKALGVAGLAYNAAEGGYNAYRYATDPAYRRQFTLATTPGHRGGGVGGYMNAVMTGMEHHGLPLASGFEAARGLYDWGTTSWKNYQFEKNVAPKIQQQVQSTYSKMIAPRIQAKLKDPNARLTQADIRDFVGFQREGLTPEAKATLQQLILRAKEQGGPEFEAWGPEQWAEYSRLASNVQ